MSILQDLAGVLLIIGIWFVFVLLRGIHDHFSTKHRYNHIPFFKRPLLFLACWVATAIMILIIIGTSLFAEYGAKHGFELLATIPFILCVIFGGMFCIATIGCSLIFTFIPSDKIYSLPKF